LDNITYKPDDIQISKPTDYNVILTIRSHSEGITYNTNFEESYTYHINGDGETSRDFCFIDNVRQANLLAATSENLESVNQVYNVAVGDRTTLNQLYEELSLNLLPIYPHLQDVKPIYRDFRSGDVRHSLADISKAVKLLGFRPSHRFREGVKVAMKWYILRV
jgi:UDP-N-acetylglucosamine 4-epimerase